MELIGDQVDRMKKLLKQRAKENGNINNSRADAINQFYIRMSPGRKEWLESKGKRFDRKAFIKMLAMRLSHLSVDDLRFFYFMCHKSDIGFPKKFWYELNKK